MRPRSLISLALATVALSLWPRGARADVTSWLAVGGGYGMQRDRVTKQNQFATTLTYTLGVGSSPLSPFVVGGLVRGTSFLGLGTDLGVAVRAATGGFARGEWGAAIEAGGLWRPWLDGAYGEWPVQAILTGGSPWGLQLAVGAEFASLSGARAAVGGFAVLELDLLRLTVMRQGPTETWWYNPAPAGGHLR
ncbi:MAG TPA: hypothetical protein VGY54_16030 [Polyangiaceae bacterium]|nr:hypothetical protein [Polyangiaceae bacterium]